MTKEGEREKGRGREEFDRRGEERRGKVRRGKEKRGEERRGDAMSDAVCLPMEANPIHPSIHPSGMSLLFAIHYESLAWLID